MFDISLITIFYHLEDTDQLDHLNGKNLILANVKIANAWSKIMVKVVEGVGMDFSRRLPLASWSAALSGDEKILPVEQLVKGRWGNTTITE